jgi:two-component sensor histidine kinase
MSVSPNTVNAPNRAPLDRDTLIHILRSGLAPGSPASFAFALCCVLVALGVRLVFGLYRPDLVIFATYYPAILLATLIGGWPAGIAAQILGGLLTWLFFDPSFTPPAQAFGDQVGDFALYGLSSGLIIWACDHYRRVIRRLDEEERYRRLVVDELNHRLRNKLAVVHTILRYELRQHEDIRASVSHRLQALAAADELLMRPDRELVDMREILSAELSHYSTSRIHAEGDETRLPAKLAATLTLIFHELATNAAKHGALNLPAGEVSISWKRRSDTLAIPWIESGGPPVCPPQRRGFGTGLFRRALDPFNGTISMQYEPTGLRCEISLEIPG